jgi:hypothetical protein
MRQRYRDSPSNVDTGKQSIAAGSQSLPGSCPRSSRSNPERGLAGTKEHRRVLAQWATRIEAFDSGLQRRESSPLRLQSVSGEGAIATDELSIPESRSVHLNCGSQSTHLPAAQNNSIASAITRMVHLSSCWLVCSYNLHLVAKTS